jgi:predicted RNA binding protein YcfA (HicA-like mRNA interferase family)
MTRGLFNWTFYDVKKFLEEHGFVRYHTEGSHYYFVGNKGRVVQVPFHGSKVLKVRTLKGIMRQSGISVDVWRNF